VSAQGWHAKTAADRAAAYQVGYRLCACNLVEAADGAGDVAFGRTVRRKIAESSCVFSACADRSACEGWACLAVAVCIETERLSLAINF
jgi:hypothetical protein